MGNGGRNRGPSDELESNEFCHPMFDGHHVGMGSEAAVSRLIEVTNLPLLREVEIGPMDCPCTG